MRNLILHPYNPPLTMIRQVYICPKKIKADGVDTDNAEPYHPILVIINNIDLLAADQSSKGWNPRNRQETKFLNKIIEICKNSYDSNHSDSDYSHLKVLITARSLDYPQNINTSNDDRKYIKEISLDKGIPFSEVELLLTPNGDEFKQLRWELQFENSGLVLATRHIEFGNAAERQQRLESLLEALQANSSEMGTRVVRHIVRNLDKAGGRKHETLLWYLSCFNTPFTRFVFDEVFRFCGSDGVLSKDKTSSQFHEGAVVRSNEHFLNKFLSLGLLQEIGPEPHEEVGFSSSNYIVPPIVKRYFREILEKTPHYPHAREFGLHGLLSSGPFNSPGCSKKPKKLFDHFVQESFRRIEEIERDNHGENTVIAIPAVLDILRSNFACNSVPLWGVFRDYIDMLSVSIDLVRNYAKATGDFWSPVPAEVSARPKKETATTSNQGNIDWKSIREHGSVSKGVASAEEMLYLYNELGLTFYQTGSVQDALRVWGLATDWRKVLQEDDPIQGEMYNATLNSHLGTAYMQLGRMQTARECFDKAIASAQENQDPDLECRMRGMLARIDHFRGNIKDAKRTYVQVVSELGRLGNRRAQCYFMRHLAALEARFGDIKHATELANQSMAIAASEDARDLMAFASELKARVYRAANEDKMAMREYSIALAQAEKLDIARLNDHRLKAGGLTCD